MVLTIILALTLNPHSYVHSAWVVTSATADLGAGTEDQVYRELLEGNHLPVAPDQLPSQSQVAGPSQPYICWLVINVLLIEWVQCLGDHFWAVVSHKRCPISSNSFGAISEERWQPISLVSACFYQYIVLFITFIGPGGFRLIKFTPQRMPNSSCIKGVTAVWQMLRSFAHFVPLLHAASVWNSAAQKNVHTYFFRYRVQYNTIW